MLDYLIRRILLGLGTLLLITFVVYGLIRVMPGDPLLVVMESMGPDKQPRPEDIERMREMFGLNDPWYVAYFEWLGRTLTGDLGNSLSRKAPVASLIAERIGPTLMLSVSSLLLTYLLAIPMGLYATARSNRLDERVLSTALYMLYSLPSFVAALLLQMLFAIHLRGTPFELPLFGMVSDNFDTMSRGEQLMDLFRHAVLPVTCYTYASLAYYSRFVRANMQEVIRQDYIRTARAKGVGPTAVLLKHAFRNTLIPLVTLIGLTLPTLLSGAIILEQIFSWPGMGKLFFESIRERDYPTLMGLMLMFSVLTLLGQLLADLLYAIVDPRVSYS
ncbi:Glutathione transport system permease protein GsiC [Botrimarina colliarenosi]|uniref:Glutathione transport system permease protein GsiC n=1 Tax=Botrimarina colliarenosi TaxID=2528001 RepID=A0A5C6ACB6_9BACT|nr:ABC transporter permease [Botrimarina colliarenosi]TWT96711.1 Glutathione transport system permease protein GsiC [Botrimarina colliarenosi]